MKQVITNLSHLAAAGNINFYNGNISAHYCIVCDSKAYRECNPRLEFSIPVFGIIEFPIPGSRRDWRSIGLVKELRLPY